MSSSITPPAASEPARTPPDLPTNANPPDRSQPAEPPATDNLRSAWSDPGSHVRLWLMAAAGLALDLWSKTRVFGSLGQGGRTILVPHVLEFQTMMNDGALFGIGRGQTLLFVAASILALGLVLWMFAHSSARSRLLHVALGALLAGATGNMWDRIFVKIVEVQGAGSARYYQLADGRDGQTTVLREFAPRPGRTALEIPLTALRQTPEARGYVRDFIKIPTTLPPLSWIPARWQNKELWPWVFNVADMLLVGGVSVLALRLWRERGSARPAAQPPAQ